MITYRLQIAVGGRAQALTIHADCRVLDETAGIGTQVFLVDGRWVARVPSAVIISISES